MRLWQIKSCERSFFDEESSAFFSRPFVLCNNILKADFYGWKFGPVLLDIRSEYVTGSMLSKVTGTLSEAAKDLVRFVYDRYNDLSFWKLSALSHGEVSWKYARKGLDAKDNGNVTMRVADMKLDAAREYYRRKRG